MLRRRGCSVLAAVAVGGDDSANDVAWFTGEAWTNAWTNTTHVRSDETDRRAAGDAENETGGGRGGRRERVREKERREKTVRKPRESRRTNADGGRFALSRRCTGSSDCASATYACVRIDAMITMFTTTMTIGDAGNATLPEELPRSVQPRSLSARN